MAGGRTAWCTLVAACCAALLGRNAAELLADPQLWHTESASSEMNGLAYDPVAEVLYEVGYRYTDVDTGAYLGSKYYFMRGIDLATGNTTFVMQNGSDQDDAFHGESVRKFNGLLDIDINIIILHYISGQVGTSRTCTAVVSSHPQNLLIVLSRRCTGTYHTRVG